MTDIDPNIQRQMNALLDARLSGIANAIACTKSASYCLRPATAWRILSPALQEAADAFLKRRTDSDGNLECEDLLEFCREFTQALEEAADEALEDTEPEDWGALVDAEYEKLAEKEPS